MSKGKIIALVSAGILGASAIAGLAYADKNGYITLPNLSISHSTPSNTTNTDLINQFNKFNENLATATTKIQNLEAEKSELQEKYNSSVALYNELLASSETSEAELESARQDITKLSSELDTKNADITALTEEVYSLKAQIEVLTKAYDELMSTYTNAVLDNDTFSSMLKGTLTHLRIPDGITTLPKDALTLAKNITSIDLNEIETLEYSSFTGGVFDTLDLQNVKNVYYCAFGNYSASKKIHNIIGSNVEYLASGSFDYALSPSSDCIQTIDLSNCKDIIVETTSNNPYGFGSYTYADIIKLSNISLPSYRFSVNCGSRLKTFQVGNVNNFGEADRIIRMENQPGLETLIFTGNEVMQSLTLSSACTKFYDGTASIYVPDELVEDYKTDAYWSGFADLIKPMSELPTE